MEEVSASALFTEQQFRTGKWSKEEDDLLRAAVELFGERKWRQVSEHVPGRSSVQCLHRWTKILRPGLTKGSWTAAEDQQLTDWVRNFGAGKWSQCALQICGRSGKQCRERWMNALNPDLKRTEWEEQEDHILLQEFERLGPKWTEIAKALPGRAENAIKNRFYSTVRKLRPKNQGGLPAHADFFAEDEIDDPSKVEAEMQVFNLLKHMQTLELLLSNTKFQISALEQSIDADNRELQV